MRARGGFWRLARLHYPSSGKFDLQSAYRRSILTAKGAELARSSYNNYYANQMYYHMFSNWVVGRVFDYKW